MALTELQQVAKAEFYRRVLQVGTELNLKINQWKDFAEMLAEFGTADLDAMGVPTGQIRTDLVNFRVGLNELVSHLEGDTVAPTNAMTDVVDEVRSL